MAEENKTMSLEERKSHIIELCKEFNGGQESMKSVELTKLDQKIVNAVNEYTAEARRICFEECKETGNPMLEAVKRLSFDTVGIQDKKDPVSGLITRSLEDRTKQIDLLKLHQHCGGIGADKNWPFMIERLNYLMTARIVRELEIKPDKSKDVKPGTDPETEAKVAAKVAKVITNLDDSYAMSAIAKDVIRFGTKDKNGNYKDPLSNKTILGTLNTVVEAMLGPEYKAKGCDVRFLLECHTCKGRKALTIKCANHRFMRGYMAEVCHRIVLNESYDAIYPTKKI